LPPDIAESKRYVLTGALDDLSDTTDPVERLALANHVLITAAELLCDHRRAWWPGGGKWLPRRLLEVDEEFGAALVDAHLRLGETGHAEQFLKAAAGVLDLVGGPVREGYRRTWHGVIESLA